MVRRQLLGWLLLGRDFWVGEGPLVGGEPEGDGEVGARFVGDEDVVEGHLFSGAADGDGARWWDGEEGDEEVWGWGLRVDGLEVRW